jgi:hypothetical protein
MSSPYVYSTSRSRRRAPWRRWVLVLIGLAVLFLAPALAHSDVGRCGAVSHRMESSYQGTPGPR